MKKKGFTVPEVLIVMVIIGIVSMLTITVIRPSDKYIRYGYFTAYKSLSDAVYNVKQDADEQFDEGREDVPSEDKFFPFTPQDFCKKLATNPNAEPDSKDSKYGYLNTVIYNCSSSFKTVSINGSDSEFNDENIAFITANSMKFYITPAQVAIIPDALVANFVTPINYFIVWVDLSGNRHPNTAKWTKSKPADIVPFVVTTEGKVYPVGYPVVDARYMRARIKYQNDGVETYSSTMTYFDAQAKAFGDRIYPSYDVASINTGYWNKLLSGTSVEVAPTDYSSQDIPVDEKCKTVDIIEGVSHPPNCKIIVER